MNKTHCDFCDAIVKKNNHVVKFKFGKTKYKIDLFVVEYIKNGKREINSGTSDICEKCLKSFLKEYLERGE